MKGHVSETWMIQSRLQSPIESSDHGLELNTHDSHRKTVRLKRGAKNNTKRFCSSDVPHPLSLRTSITKQQAIRLQATHVKSLFKKAGTLLEVALFGVVLGTSEDPEAFALVVRAMELVDSLADFRVLVAMVACSEVLPLVWVVGRKLE